MSHLYKRGHADCDGYVGGVRTLKLGSPTCFTVNNELILYLSKYCLSEHAGDPEPVGDGALLLVVVVALLLLLALVLCGVSSVALLVVAVMTLLL